MLGPTKIAGAGGALASLKLLADDTRWRLLGALRSSDRQAGELAGELALPQNLVSYHLGLLRRAGLVQVHRSDADARVLYYGLDLGAVREAYRGIGEGMLLERPVPAALPQAAVAFLCTHNSARSQMAEAWLRQLSGGQVTVRSAGTEPSALHPLAVEAMAEVGIDIGYQASKGLESLLATRLDVIVTVCDLAREQCPPHFRAPVRLHWSMPDPARVEGERDARLATFRASRDQLRVRVEGLLAALPVLLRE